MRIGILGAGAVGGYFGGRLAMAGVPVRFLVRPKRYQQLREHKLWIHTDDEEWQLEPNLAATPEELGHVDVLLVALKNYHLEAAFPTLDEVVKRGARLLPLLNGMDHLDILSERYGSHRVLGGTCYIETTLDEDGHVRKAGPMHDLVFGPRSEEQKEFAEKLYQTMLLGKFRVTLSEQIETEMWRKYTFLTCLSGMTAATRSPVGVFVNDEFSLAYLHSLAEEIIRIARAEGAQLPTEMAKEIAVRMQKASPSLTSSMHRDLEKGLPLELESLQGGFLRRAHKHQIAAPHLAAIYALLHPYIQGKPQHVEWGVTLK
ncbi:ketopantoate reductase family protein [Alicyclobacillus sp. TC]|uniref:ketopantoate reductase family protein n=1 Tax=Alicyclobacillus sp. TC TaxID=2606450 RepID=UPI00193174B9|nr:ketopantoate reductase family protein [Alicyclobacillus sp. TC]QRF22577.1 ketopantoate reductase family protein [Alicyclobacillus sp. TC]